MYYTFGLIILALIALKLVLSVAHQFRQVRASASQVKLEKQLFKQKIQQIIDQSKKKNAVIDAWAGWRKFQVSRIVQENDTIKSFYLQPHDGKPLPGFEPGQHLTFRLKIPGKSKPIIRCYSLSDSPTEKGHYRATIRKQAAPPKSKNVPNGVSSCYFHDVVAERDILDVKAPSGKFYLDITEKTPVVMVAGGVGLTPSLSMLNTLHALGSEREIWLFYAVRDKTDLIMVAHFKRLNKEIPNLHIHFFFADIEEDKLTKSLHKGFVSVARMRELGAPTDADFYICGPPPMMKSIVEGLEEIDVDQQRIHFESFGPASITKSVVKSSQKETKDATNQEFSVAYSVSNTSTTWTKASGTLLDLSEASDIEIDSGCRAGSCGTCLTALLSGEVSYIDEPGIDVEKGCCLPCIAIPTSDIKLNA